MTSEVGPVKGKDIFSIGSEGRNIISEMFDGFPIRGLVVDGKIRLYSKDVGEAAGLAQSHISKIVGRIREEHPGMLMHSTLESIGERDPKLKGRKIHLVTAPMTEVIGIRGFTPLLYSPRAISSRTDQHFQP